MEAAQLQQLLEDVKAKREELLIYVDNINFLKEKQAQLEQGGSLHVHNELKETEKQLSAVREALRQLEEKLKVDFSVDPSKIENLDTISREEIAEFAVRVVKKQHSAIFDEEDGGVEYDPIQQMVEQAYTEDYLSLQKAKRGAELEERRAQEAAGTYGSTVFTVLRELRDAAYPPSCEVVCPRVRFAGNPLWAISQPHTERDTIMVSVELQFDTDCNPVAFECRRYRHGYRRRLAQADLSQSGLIAALKVLHRELRPPQKKNWWQIWNPPTLPADWVS